MRRGRFDFGSPRRWAVGLGIGAASLAGGTLIAQATVGAMDPFYRYAAPAGWREPRVRASLEPTTPAPVIYSPIGWADAASPPLPSEPYASLDDPSLLERDRERATDPVFVESDPADYDEADPAPVAPVLDRRDMEIESSLDPDALAPPEPQPEQMDSTPADAAWEWSEAR